MAMGMELMDAPGEGDLTTPAPTQSLVTSEQSRVLASTQAALAVAQGRPRDERKAIDRIKNSCQRPRLAEQAEYEYSRGGTSITGASIQLMTAIASHWGNLEYGFRELSRGNGESTVEAVAWDLETNTRRVISFVVPHRMPVGRGEKRLTNARDIYEWVSNQAQRRVRTCLEQVIPKDVVDEARDVCRETLKTNVDLTPDRIKGMLQKFETDFGVTKKQIEARIQRNLESITPAQFVRLGRIYASLKDEMSLVEDWFQVDAPEDSKKPASSATDQAKEMLKNRPQQAPKPQEHPGPDPDSAPAGAAAQAPNASAARDKYEQRLNLTSKLESLEKLRKEIAGDLGLSDSDRSDLVADADDRIGILKAEAEQSSD